MDDAAANSNDSGPAKREEESHPVVWTPEDASRFLTNAIHESQKPLADALKSRPITTSTLVLVLVIIVAAAAGIGWILYMQLEKTEKLADSARTSRDEALLQQHQLQAKSETLEARLESAKAEFDRLNQEYLTESESLRGQIQGKRDNEEELRRIQTELTRFRRQNELLRNQISGLEMEKQALARQLEAVRALAIDEGMDFLDTGDAARQPVPQPEPPEETPPLSRMTEPVQPEPPVAEAPVLPAPSEPAPMPAAPEIATPQPSQPMAEPVAEEPEQSPEPIAEPESPLPAAEPETPEIGITGRSETNVDTVTVDAVPAVDGGIGNLTVGVNGENPPTLYESTQEAVTSAETPITITGSVPITTPAQPVASSEPANEPEEIASEEPEQSAEETPAPAEPEASESSPEPAAMDSDAMQYSKELPLEPAPAAADSAIAEEPTGDDHDAPLYVPESDQQDDTEEAEPELQEKEGQEQPQVI